MSAMAGAAAGAQKGGAAGGPWGALAGAIIGFFVGDIAAKQREEAAKEMLKTAKARNDAMLAESARGMGELNRARTTAFIKTNQALLYYRRQASSETSSLANNYAAADVIGASAVAVKSELDKQRDEALSQTVFNSEVQQENINTQVDNLAQSTMNRYYDPSADIGEIFAGHDAMSEIMSMGDSAIQANSSLNAYKNRGGGSSSSGGSGYGSTASSGSSSSMSSSLGVSSTSSGG